jgi:hypothetical protein
MRREGGGGADVEDDEVAGWTMMQRWASSSCCGRLRLREADQDGEEGTVAQFHRSGRLDGGHGGDGVE